MHRSLHGRNNVKNSEKARYCHCNGKLPAASPPGRPLRSAQPPIPSSLQDAIPASFAGFSHSISGDLARKRFFQYMFVIRGRKFNRPDKRDARKREFCNPVPAIRSEKIQYICPNSHPKPVFRWVTTRFGSLISALVGKQITKMNVPVIAALKLRSRDRLYHWHRAQLSASCGWKLSPNTTLYIDG